MREKSSGCAVVSFFIGIVPSLWLVLSALTNTYLGFPHIAGDSFGYGRCEPTIDDPRVRLFFLAIGLLVGGVGLYAIAVSTIPAMRDDWPDTEYDQLVILPSVAGVVLAVLIVLFFFGYSLCGM